MNIIKIIPAGKRGKIIREDGFMRINHNISALNAYRQLSVNNTSLQKSLEKLSSGLRINRAGDDAAGLAISEKMRGQIRGLEMAVKNAQDGISLIQTAEGALNETHAILQRMRELAVQATNDTNTIADRREIQKEINQLIEEIDRIAETTEFNTKKLLNGDLDGATSVYRYQTDQISGTVTIQTGTNDKLAFNVNGQAKTITLDAGTYTAGQLAQMIQQKLNESPDLSGMTVTESGGVLTFEAKFLFATEDSTDSTANTDLNITASTEASKVASNETIKSLFVANVDTASTGGVLTKDSATAAISNIDAAIQQVSAERSKLGAYQNRLEHTINNLGTAAENLTAAESRIRDVDMAKEMMEFTKMNILNQAATAMLAQANMMPQSVLKLLG
ncbi:MAG TPA: flagellin [Parasegetibacter sp.]